MKTAIYIRVSTEEQVKEGYSISAQKQKLKAYCIAQDWDVSGFYVDEGISAKDMNRPELKRMLEDIKLGKIDCVLVYRLDRLTRSVLDLYKMLQTFDKYDCKFKSSTEVFETTTAMGRMFITIVAAMAQWERENLGERVRMGTAEKVRQGKYAHNIRPIGYNLDLATGKLTINEDEAKTIRLIYDLYLKGLGAHKVSKYLNERNITTKDGNYWHDSTLMQVLKNPVYMGDIRWGNVYTENADSVPAIIDRETFTQVQSTIEKRRGLSPKQISSTYIFSGALKCPECGKTLHGHGSYAKLASGEKVIYRYYRCMNHFDGLCKNKETYSEIKMDEAILRYLMKIEFSNFDEVVELKEKDLKQKKKDYDYRETLEKELEKIEQRKKKWQYAWSKELILDDEFRDRMNEERSLEETIKEQLKEEVQEEVCVSKNELLDILKDFRANWTHLTKEEKKSFVLSFIKQIDFYKEKHKGINIISIDFY